MSSPEIATRFFHAAGTASDQVIENGEPIWVHGVVFTTSGGSGAVLEDANGTTVLSFRSSVFSVTIDGIWLAENGLQIPSSVTANQWFTIFYRPTG